MLLAHVSDPHVTSPERRAYRIVDTARGLARTIDTLLARRPRPDAVILTGDLACDGRPEEYAQIARELERLPMPVFAIPGNHDERGAFRAHLVPRFCPTEDPTFLQFAVELDDLVLIGLDTLVEGSEGGALCARRLAWLEAALAKARDRSVVLALHHPPFATGIPFMDAIALAAPDRLETLVRAHGRVERVLCGHVHRSIQTLWAGTLASIAPATAHQVGLVLDPTAPSSFTFEPPGFQLHLRLPEGRWVTHLVPVGDWPGPYRFAEYAAG
ncbi:MAG: phosphodiesterase [Geminicoccaceae bacterium]|nr:phosphodiesterase [Geminicoccaceae bacterium]MCX7629256.1 phosphodiesterase [Geminicoccaceae bacterium]